MTLTNEKIEEIFQSVANDDPEVHLRFARAIESELRSSAPVALGGEKGEAVAQTKRDAARYRWLRAGNYPISFARSVLNDTPHGIDAAIDAAIASQPPRGV